MTPKFITYALIALALAGVATGIWYNGRSYQRNVDLLAKADTGIVVKLKPDTVKLPPDTLYRAAKPAPKPVLAPKTGLVDSLREVIADLLEPAQVVMTTPSGETIDITYYPKTDSFKAIVQPLIITAPTERYITRDIPEVPPLTRDFWIGVDAMSAGGPAVMGTLGYKTVGFKVGLISDKFAWGIALHLPL